MLHDTVAYGDGVGVCVYVCVWIKDTVVYDDSVGVRVCMYACESRIL